MVYKELIIFGSSTDETGTHISYELADTEQGRLYAQAALGLCPQCPIYEHGACTRLQKEYSPVGIRYGAHTKTPKDFVTEYDPKTGKLSYHHYNKPEVLESACVISTQLKGW